MFDLYGDHLLSRDGWAPVAGLVDLLGAVDINPPAVRTAVSRLVREGWLDGRPREGVRGYEATPRAIRRLTDAWQRIYAAEPAPWDGTWDVVVLDAVPDRAIRARAAASLEFLGYARLSAGTWVSPHPSDGLADSLTEVGYERFGGGNLDGDPAELVARLWDLPALVTAHEAFLRWATEQAALAGSKPSPRSAYAVRTRVVHEWRKFLFTDPGLPTAVLPPDWAGERAARTFGTIASDLAPAATAYVTACLAMKENR